MEVDYRDYPCPQLARAVLERERVAQFIEAYRRLDETSHTLNDWVAMQLSDTGFDEELVKRRLAALDAEHEREMRAFVAQHFPERVGSKASLATRIFTRFLYDADFHGRDLLFARNAPVFFRGHALTLVDMLTVFLWARYDSALQAGQGVRDAPAYIREEIGTVSADLHDPTESSARQRVEFLHQFHAYIHYTMQTSAEYVNGSMLRLSYKAQTKGGGGVVYVTSCGERTSECNAVFVINRVGTRKLVSLMPSLAPAEITLTLGCACGRLATHKHITKPRAYCSTKCYLCDPLI